MRSKSDALSRSLPSDLEHVTHHEEPGLEVIGHRAGALDAHGRGILAGEPEQGMRIDAAEPGGAVEARAQQVDDALAELGELRSTAHGEGEHGDDVG